MTAHDFIDHWIQRALPARDSRLHEAMWDAVVPGGKRVRALLVVLAAEACGCDPRHRELVGRFAAAVELVHCASLVHDDMPCFDDADTRRGRPTTHVAYGEPTALLVGDALIVLAFETLARCPGGDARAALRLVAMLAEHTGSARGIIGGQGLELDPAAPLAEIHRKKTAALFRAAAAGASIAVGCDDQQLRYARFGELVGEVLQLRDDLDDAAADAAIAKPNAVTGASPAQVLANLRAKVSDALALLDDTPAAQPLAHVLAKAAGM